MHVQQNALNRRFYCISHIGLGQGYWKREKNCISTALLAMTTSWQWHQLPAVQNPPQFLSWSDTGWRSFASPFTGSSLQPPEKQRVKSFHLASGYVSQIRVDLSMNQPRRTPCFSLSPPCQHLSCLAHWIMRPLSKASSSWKRVGTVTETRWDMLAPTFQ